MKAEVIITFSNGEQITVGEKNIIFPIALVEDKGEKFTSTTKQLVLSEYFHHNHGYIPELTSVFAANEFFTVDTDDTYTATVYKTSSIVSLKQIEI